MGVCPLPTASLTARLTGLRRHHESWAPSRLLRESPPPSKSRGVWSVDLDVPRKRLKLDRVKETLFPNGNGPFDQTITVCFPKKTTDPYNHPGQLKILSPIEIVHALLLHVHDSIDAGADHHKIKKLRAMLLSVPVCIVVGEDWEELHFKSV